MAETATITKLINLARLYADEPSVTAKYTDTELLEIIESITQTVLADINTTSDSTLKVRHNLTLAEGTQTYLLPPNVERIEEIAEIDSTTGRPLWRLKWKHQMATGGPVMSLEGRTMRLDPKWTETYTMQMTYVPSGDFKWHYGTGTTPTSTSLVLSSAPTAGALDTRENAYVGAVLRILNDTNGYVQERTITAYNRTTRVATVDPPFSPTPSGTITYEVIPFYGRLLLDVLALRLAMRLRGLSGNPQVRAELEREFSAARRSLRIKLDNTNGIEGDHFSADSEEPE